MASVPHGHRQDGAEPQGSGIENDLAAFASPISWHLWHNIATPLQTVLAGMAFHQPGLVPAKGMQAACYP